MFLDCAPAISLASESVFAAADVLLVPLIPTPLSLRTYDQLRGFVADEVPKPRPRILAFLSMTDGRKSLHRDVAAELARRRRRARRARSRRRATSSGWARSGARSRSSPPRGRAARAYGALWTELRGRLAD